MRFDHPAHRIERGGDPDDLTVFGHSGGAMVGAQVAMVSEPPWPGIDCDAGTSHAPQRFIGSAGDYNGLYQLSQVVPAEFFAPYDPTVIEPTNTDLEVRLVQGLSDGTIGMSESSEFLAHVLSYGLDAELIITGSAGHGESRPNRHWGRSAPTSAIAAAAPISFALMRVDGESMARTTMTALRAGQGGERRLGGRRAATPVASSRSTNPAA